MNEGNENKALELACKLDHAGFRPPVDPVLDKTSPKTWVGELTRHKDKELLSALIEDVIQLPNPLLWNAFIALGEMSF